MSLIKDKVWEQKYTGLGVRKETELTEKVD